jgi:hypothetical protein
MGSMHELAQPYFVFNLSFATAPFAMSFFEYSLNRIKKSLTTSIQQQKK